MPTIRHYIPDFMDFLPGPPDPFETMAGLRAVPFVARWADDPEFVRFSRADHGPETALIAHMKDGEYRVIGFIDTFPFPGSEELELWSAP